MTPPRQAGRWSGQEITSGQQQRYGKAPGPA